MSDDEKLADFLMSKQWQDAQAKALTHLAQSCQAVERVPLAASAPICPNCGGPAINTGLTVHAPGVCGMNGPAPRGLTGDEVAAAMAGLMQNAYPGPLEGLQNVRISYDGETAQVSVEPIDIYKPVPWLRRLWWRLVRRGK